MALLLPGEVELLLPACYSLLQCGALLPRASSIHRLADPLPTRACPAAQEPQLQSPTGPACLFLLPQPYSPSRTLTLPALPRCPLSADSLPSRSFSSIRRFPTLDSMGSMQQLDPAGMEGGKPGSFSSLPPVRCVEGCLMCFLPWALGAKPGPGGVALCLGVFDPPQGVA